MKYGPMFLLSGILLSSSGFLLKIISYSDLFNRPPPYMGPPVDPDTLYVMRMWEFPYVLDTLFFILLGMGAGLITLGIILFRKKQVELSSSV
ncbi:MAG: hypothetical protein HY222_04820 [Thaumarchaeota archaeon]|nr:hypothetical protein [Nitrososphaerota archaeon]MBI3641697.1 hypothetical protein [Nitrososphaerota archaeon]